MSEQTFQEWTDEKPWRKALMASATAHIEHALREPPDVIMRMSGRGYGKTALRYRDQFTVTPPPAPGPTRLDLYARRKCVSFLFTPPGSRG